MSDIKPTLRIFARLDEEKLSDAFKEGIGRDEGDFELVDWDRARDLPWTEEIMASVVSFVLVDDEGNELTEVDSLEKAERVRSTAKVTFSVEVDDQA